MNRNVLITLLSLLALVWSGCGPAAVRSPVEIPPVETPGEKQAVPTALLPLSAAPQATASQAETPAAQPVNVEIIAGWDFAAQQKALGWKPANDLARFAFDSSGLKTRSTGGDPYMNGPSIQLDPLSAPHLEIRMRSSHGNDAQIFWEADGQSFNENASQHFTITPDGAWHTYRLDLKGHPAWRGTITRIRLDPSNQSGADLAVAWIRALGPLPADLRVRTFGPSSAIQAAGQPFALNAVVSNMGDLPASQAGLRLDYPPALKLLEGDPEQALPTLEAGGQAASIWKLSGPAGVYPVALLSGSQRLKSTSVIIEDAAAGDILDAGSQTIRLRFARQPFGYGAGTLEWKNGPDWATAGRIRSLGQITYRDAAGSEHEVYLYAAKGSEKVGRTSLSAEAIACQPAGGQGCPPYQETGGSEKGGGLTFEVSITTVDGAALGATVTIQPVEDRPDRPWLNLEYRLKTDRPVDLLRWSGPEYLAGEGSFGAQYDSGLFPGLEFLMAGEQSSGKDFVAPPGSLRYVPQPNKITLPFMSVTAQGGASGLMWDPLQTWDGAHDRPAALYAVPNTWENQSNHLMRLFVPGLTAGLEENQDRLSTPFIFQPGHPLRLSAALFAAPASDPLAALETYLDYSHLRENLARPDAIGWPRSLEAEARLCLQSYTDSTWDAAKAGWHYTLNDPWGPGSNPAVELHLWLDTLDGKRNDRDKKLRKMVQAARSSAPAGGQPNLWYYQPAFILNMVGSLDDLRSQLDGPLAMAAQQRADGSWGFQPAAGSAQSFGSAGDTSNGYTATQALPVLYFARLTGDPRLVSAGRKALDYLSKQPLRPEGAQTWELSLHVPDLLASSWVMQAFIEGYRLTGEARYLTLAERWALAGLPFIYTWNPTDRPVMRYTTIPVFGASNYTSPWFGRPVMWNGLDYAIGLQNLAAEQAQAGISSLLDWRRLAEGITSAAAQMQPENGPYAGMYPDAWDTTTGEEAYTWWLSPTYVMQNLLLLQQHPASQVTTRIFTLDGAQVHINAPAADLRVESAAHLLRLRLRYAARETSAIWITGLAAIPKKVSVNGTAANQDSAWTGSGTGWMYQDGMLLIRAPFGFSGEADVEIEF